MRTEAEIRKQLAAHEAGAAAVEPQPQAERPVDSGAVIARLEGLFRFKSHTEFSEFMEYNRKWGVKT